MEFNSRMPYMPFNWFVHSARVCRLTLAERGLFDAARAELWTVVGCKMPPDTLRARLRIAADTPEAAMLDNLVQLGLLVRDSDGRVYDEVQAQEFALAVQKANVNRQNGARGGRPTKATPPPPQPPGNDDDF